MIDAGLPIVRALYVLSEQTGNKKLKETIDAVRKEVEAGLALSEALEKHPKIFSRLYVEMVRAGEVGGILDEMLLRIAGQLEQDQELGRKVKSAMAYPTVILILAILVASFMLILIVPIFEDVPGLRRGSLATDPDRDGPLGYLDEPVRGAHLRCHGC
jgi:type IV pilus assembly protein PilC